MNLHKMLFGAAVACCTFAGVAMAGNDTPPPWAGTGLVGNSTHWEWDFNQPNSPFPSSGNGAPNTPPPMITGGTWVPASPTGGSGFWCLNPGESMFIEVGNFPQPNDFKLMWVQYHLWGIPGAVVSQPLIDVVFGPQPGTPYGTWTSTPQSDGSVIGAQGFQFPFNPPFELFRITNPSTVPMYFDWLTIDTICAPTPGAGAALLLGSTALLRRRR